jgi:hypothetical protein
MSPSLLAGAAMLPATLSRYETWPVAVVVSAFAFLRKDEPVAWKRVVAGLLPLVGPIGWVFHNRLAHGDALLFLHRVASYRAALGPAGSHPGGGLAYVGSLFAGCPAVLFALVGLIVVRFHREGRVAATQRLRPFFPWAAGAGALLAFLTVGEFVGGAPTHHPERAFLSVWLLATLAVVDLVKLERPPIWWVVGACALLALDYRSALSDRGIDRRLEEMTGTQLRSLVPRGERVYVAADDYGYFAVVAAFGRPSDAVIDQTHDPRAGHDIAHDTSLLADRWSAPDRLRAENAQWLVAPAPLVFPIALRQRTRNARLAVYELQVAR